MNTPTPIASVPTGRDAVPGGHSAHPTAASPGAAARAPAVSGRPAAAGAGTVPPPPGAWPPGPPSGLTGWPLLWRMRADLLGTLADWQRRHGDVFHLRIVPEHQVVVADPAAVHELLVAQHAGLVRWPRGMRALADLHGRSVLIAEGDAWRERRRVLQPEFAPQAVERFVPTLVRTAGEHLDAWPRDAGDVAIDAALTRITVDAIARRLFSRPLGVEADAVAGAVRTLNAEIDRAFYRPFRWPDAAPWQRAKRAALATLRGLVARELAARQATAPGTRADDLLTRLLALHADDPAAWPLELVRDELVTALVGGHETVAATLAWWAACMAANPDAQRLAAEEVSATLGDAAPTAATALPVVERTLQETLRLYPAAPVLATRCATRPVALAGWSLPAGTLFLVPVWLLHRDARWFPEPLAFRPERFAPGAPTPPRGAYLPFGLGPRVCLGQHLALAELRVVAAMLLQRFELACDGDPMPAPRLQLSLRPARPLRLRLRARSHAGAARG